MVDLHREVMEGRVSVPRVGAVIALPGKFPPYGVVDCDGRLVDAVDAYLRSLALSDNSASTCRSYANDLLRWFRLLWLLDIPWQEATEAEVMALIGWMRVAPNPQRRRRPDSPPAGSINLRTGKPYLALGYAPRSINHNETVVSKFYEYHGGFQRGPAANPVPQSPARREAWAHHNPMDPRPRHRRARGRQKVTKTKPRALEDRLFDELFDAMQNDRDRALIELYVSSGARASELLGVTLGDVDWPGQRLYVITKGTREREPVPASPKGLLLLAAYLDRAGLPGPGMPIFRTLRGQEKPLDYFAMRRAVQRANARLGTNITLHDLRHTAATRMANSDELTLVEVQAIMRHSDLAITSDYLGTTLEQTFDKLQAFFTRPRVERTFAPGYDPEDVRAVFGG